jgi:hypothetical protein
MVTGNLFPREREQQSDQHLHYTVATPVQSGAVPANTLQNKNLPA